MGAWRWRPSRWASPRARWRPRRPGGRPACTAKRTMNIHSATHSRCSNSSSRSGQSQQMRDVLIAMIKAHEIQGVIALENGFNRVGLDHVMLVRIASAAVCAQMLGCSRDEVCAAISHAWIDGSALRTYRHAPNTGSRKSWAAGDASARGLFLALMAKRGEMGYPSALTANTWGFHDVLFRKKELKFKKFLSVHV